MTTSCTAPVTGQHRTPKAAATCPACNGHTGTTTALPAPALPSAPADPAAAAQEALDAMVAASRPLAAAAYEAERKVVVIQATGMMRVIQTTCPSTRTIRANIDGDTDTMIVRVTCDCTDGQELYQSQWGLDHGVGHVIDLAVNGIDTARLWEHSGDTVFRYDEAEPYDNTLIIDMPALRAVECGISDDNTEALDMFRDNPRWWSLTKDSPEVAITLSLHPNAT